MTEAQISPWLELLIFASAGLLLWRRWKGSDVTTFFLLALVALSSWSFIWMTGDHTPTAYWAVLDIVAGSMLYYLRSVRVSTEHLGIQRQHATVIGIFATMALAHFVYSGMLQSGYAIDTLIYGRTLIILTYAQLFVVMLAERVRANDARTVYRASPFSRLGNWLSVYVSFDAPRRRRGY